MHKFFLTAAILSLPLGLWAANAPGECCRTKEACCLDTCCKPADPCCKAEPRKPCTKDCAHAPKEVKK